MKSGHISIVSSIAGYRGLPNSSGYGPSIAALTNFSVSIYKIAGALAASDYLFHYFLFGELYCHQGLLGL